MSNGMSLLAGLPADCWFLVLESLSEPDLKSLCLVSRGLHASARVFLYRKIRRDWDSWSFECLLQLLRAIHSRSEYPALILSVMLEAREKKRIVIPRSNTLGWDPRVNSKLVSSKGGYNVVRKFCLSIVEDAMIPQQAVWKKGLKEGNPYVYAAILLSQLPNIRDLGLDDSFIYQGGFPGLVIRHAVLSAPEGVMVDFDRLSCIRYGTKHMSPLHDSSHDTGSSILTWNTEQFVGLFFLPALTHVELGVPWPVRLRLAERISSVCESGVRHNLSSLHSCTVLGFVEGDDLTFLVREMRSIESLRLFSLQPLKHGREFEEALSQTKSTLKRFGMSPFHFDNGRSMLDGRNRHASRYPSPQNPKFSSGFFRNFSLLTRLILHFSHLVGFGIDGDPLGPNLPPSIQELGLIDDLRDADRQHQPQGGSHNAIFACLELFLASDPWRDPCLRIIRLRIFPRALPPVDIPWAIDRQKMFDLVVQCAKRHIKLDVS